MYADDLLEPWHESVRAQVPDVDVFDVHTHLGQNDPDGFRCSPDQLVEALSRVRGRAAVFPMHEPDGYSAANDRVIEQAGETEGQLVPFCRLDPADDPVAEAERALERGAVGIKLHPRAENFRLADPRAAGIFALAGERGLPLIVHAGRGIPALGRDAVDLARAHPGMKLILAHEGICDLAWIWREAAELPNLFFDTAWWSAADHLTVFSYIPPGQILFGSDAPYGTPLQSRIQVTRYALEAGLDEDQVRAVMGGQLTRILAGADPLDLGPPVGDERSGRVDLLLERVHNFIVAGLSQVLRGADGDENIALARLACEVGDDAPQAEHCRSILALIDRYESFSSSDDGSGRDDDAEGHAFPRLHALLTAAVVARTPKVPAPVPEPEDLEERRRG